MYLKLFVESSENAGSFPISHDIQFPIERTM